MKNQSFAQRLNYAAGGIRSAFRSEASFRIQLMLAVAAASTLALVRPEQHPTIRMAKDCAAAAVLVASIAAVLIGILTVAVGLHLLNKT